MYQLYELIWLIFIEIGLQPHLINYLDPEISLLLRAALWNYSIRLNSASFGQRLLFIAYDRDQLSKNHNIHKHFLFNVLLKYIRDNIVYRFTDQQSLQKCVTYSENIIAIGTMLNFFRFLNFGKKPSLVDYILGLDNISMYGNRRREIGYSHMTRELIWGGFMVFFIVKAIIVQFAFKFYRISYRNCWALLCLWSIIIMSKENAGMLWTSWHVRRQACRHIKSQPSI